MISCYLSLFEEYRGLMNKRYFVLSKIESDAVENGRIMNRDVRKWLYETKVLIEDLEGRKASRDDEVMNAEWCCEMIEKIKRLDEECKFKQFYISGPISLESLERIKSQGVPTLIAMHHNPTLTPSVEFMPIPSIKEQKGLESFPSGNFEYYFNSTNQAKGKLLEALKDDRYYVIGLYGKRGSGKTTLVKAEVDEYGKIFDRVIFPSVSKNQDMIKSFQMGIANKLNVYLEERHSNAERVSMINSKLERTDGTTLVILDDFPRKFKPRELGIPCNSNRCKVLLTTRDKTNCISMECNYSILLKPLSNDDAWTLLQNLSDVDSQPDLLKVARDVAFKCCGLPGLVKDVVSSLKGKSIEAWKETLVSLSHSTARYQIFISFRGEIRDVFTNHLYEALCKRGFKTFMDDKSLEGGVQISKLLYDIEESRCSIVLFSKNYAESKWCLKELAKIRDCMNDERKKQLVLPIFYEVLPSDPKHVENSYHDAMVKHEKRGENSETLENWKKALHDVCSLIGYTKPADRTRDAIIQDIVEFAYRNRHRLHIQSTYIN